MWAQIEPRAFGDAASRPMLHAHESRWRVATLAAAAALVIGVGLGWYVAPPRTVTHVVMSSRPTTTSGSVAVTEPAHESLNTPRATGVAIANTQPMPGSSRGPDVAVPQRVADPGATRLAAQFNDVGNGSDMGRYLAQTAALLASLPSDHAAAASDTAVATRASDLLTQTHLLLDSRAGNDPTLHRLLEDLELVLAQVARLRGSRNGADLQLIHQALTVHDVLPRVHDATVEASITD